MGGRHGFGRHATGTMSVIHDLGRERLCAKWEFLCQECMLQLFMGADDTLNLRLHWIEGRRFGVDPCHHLRHALNRDRIRHAYLSNKSKPLQICVVKYYTCSISTLWVYSDSTLPWQYLAIMIVLPKLRLSKRPPCAERKPVEQSSRNPIVPTP